MTPRAAGGRVLQPATGSLTQTHLIRRRTGSARPLSTTTPAVLTEQQPERNTARSPREPCLWRAVVSIGSWRDVILTIYPRTDAMATSEDAGHAPLL